MPEFDLTMINWMNCIWKGDLPSNSKLIAAYLRSHMNDQHDIAWPSLTTIQGKTGLSRATVVKYIDVLCDSGWLIRDRESRKSTTYIAAFPKSIEEHVKNINSLGDKLSQTSLGAKPDSLGGELGSLGAKPKVVHEVNPNKQVSKQSNKQLINKYKDVDFSVMNLTDSEIEEFIRIRRSGKTKTISQRVVNTFTKQFELAKQKGYSMDEIFDVWESRGWTGFEADWLTSKQGQSNHNLSGYNYESGDL